MMSARRKGKPGGTLRSGCGGEVEETLSFQWEKPDVVVVLQPVGDPEKAPQPLPSSLLRGGGRGMIWPGEERRLGLMQPCRTWTCFLLECQEIRARPRMCLRMVLICE